MTNPTITRLDLENLWKPEDVPINQRLLKVPDNLFEEIKLHRFTPLNINFEHAQLAGNLPAIHKDPFDRMLIAQAMIEKLCLVSRDSLFTQYDVKLLGA